MTGTNATSNKTFDSLKPADQTPAFVDPCSYKKAETSASWYLNQIKSIARKDLYLEQLSEDFRDWSKQTTTNRYRQKLSELEKQLQLGEGIDSLSFLQKLELDNQLKSYLSKSLTYIFIRDLGKSLDDKHTQKTIESLVVRIQDWVKKQSSDADQSLVNNEFIHQKAKAYQVVDTVNWLKAKLALLQQKMPEELDKTNGLRKLVKIIAGVVLHQFIDQSSKMNPSEIATRLDSAIRLGYCYGLTYPFVDDLQDSSTALNAEEKHQFNQAIRESLLQGEVVAFPEFSEKKQEKMQFVYSELKAAFEYIKDNQPLEQVREFFKQAFIFFEAQDIDRQRKLENKNYSDEELFIPIILKSAGCRLIARELVECKVDDDFDYRTFCFGIYNQFNDDIKDIFDDIEEANVTPYSYYLTKLNANESIENLNPYRIYWAVVSYLINEVYHGEPKTRQLFLERCINAHKSLKNSIGEKAYNELQQNLLKTGCEEFDQQIQRLVKEPSSVAWFDKLVSREVSAYFNAQASKKEACLRQYQEAQKFVDSHLTISHHGRVGHTQLVDAANYSLAAGGKRFRSVLALVSMCERYRFKRAEAIPVIQLLEYMHTASLVFDDKPSQDNADLRRGKPALHIHCRSEAKAELAGVYLMMKAVEVQSNIPSIAPESVLASLSYAANTTQAICEGQLLDLESCHNNTEIKSLEKLSFLKTGLAIEAALLIPAILATENDIEKEHLKRFAKYLGLVFQLKDDLLDVESSTHLLGKPIGQDVIAQKASFVTLLGESSAREKLYQYYDRALESLYRLKKPFPFYEFVLEYVVNRIK